MYQLKPSIIHLFPDGNYIFQQDNYPKHTARKNKRYIQNAGIPTFEWLVQSPDLNPIENRCFVVDAKLNDRKPRNENELFLTL